MIRMQKQLKLRNPKLVAAWPGMGNIALRAASYLMSKLKAKAFAEVQFSGPHALGEAAVEDGVIREPQHVQNTFYCWKDPNRRSDLVIFVSGEQPGSEQTYGYAQEIIEFAQTLGIRTVFTFAAMPRPIDYRQDPDVWCAATDSSLLKSAERLGLQNMDDGQISGLNGFILSVAKEKGLRGLCLLGEIPVYTIQIENPKSSAAVLRALGRLLGLSLDMGELENFGQFVEQQIARLMSMVDGSAPDAVTDDEIADLREELSEQDLPESAKVKIKGLFEATRRDLAKAPELKRELDRWEVYPLYETEFLNLFSRGRAE